MPTGTPGGPGRKVHLQVVDSDLRRHQLQRHGRRDGDRDRQMAAGGGDHYRHGCLGEYDVQRADD